MLRLRRLLGVDGEPLYRRSLDFEAHALAAQWFHVRGRLDDAEHGMMIDFVVDDLGRIRMPSLRASRMPFQECHRLADLGKVLEGSSAARDFTAAQVEALRGASGCFHAIELLSAAKHFAANVRAGLKAGWTNMHPPSTRTAPAMAEARLPTCLAFREGQPTLQHPAGQASGN